MSLSALRKSFALSVLALAAAQPAYAQQSLMVERTIEVRIAAADLKTESGIADVYTRLSRKALTTCRSERATLSFTGESLDACKADLLSQMVESTGSDALRRYHSVRAAAT